MDRIALSKRIKGLSEVFASDNEMAQDLAAMSYVLANMSDEKFSKIVNPDLGVDEIDGKEAAFGDMGFGGGSQVGPAKMQQIRDRRNQPGTSGTIRTPEEFAQMAAKVLGPETINKPGFMDKVVSELKQMKGAPDAVPGRTAYDGGGEIDEKEAAFGDMGFGGGSQVGPDKLQEIRNRRGLPGTSGTIRTPEDFARLAEKVLGPETINKPGFMDKVVSALKQMKGAPTPNAVPEKIAEEEDMEETMGMYWDKNASSAVADALLKDVLGMDKSVCCDTGRKLDKVQMPDSEKKQHTPPTLKGEQIPQDSENNDSGIVEKANKAKPVNKSAAEETEEMEETEQAAIDKIKEGLKDFIKYEEEEKEKGIKGEHEDKEQEAIEHIEKGVEMIDEAEEEEEEKEDSQIDKTPEDDDPETKRGRQPQEEGDIEEKHSKKKTASINDAVVKSEGVELIAPMSEVMLSSGDEAELGKLFD